MPVSSNYKYEPQALTATEIAPVPKAKGNGFSWLGLIRTLTLLGEIGLSLILGPEAGAAIAVGAAGIYTGLDAKQGSISSLNMGITWGAALIPVLQVARAPKIAMKNLDKAIESLREVEAVEAQLIKQGQLTPELQAQILNRPTAELLEGIRDEIKAVGNNKKGLQSYITKNQKTLEKQLTANFKLQAQNALKTETSALKETLTFKEVKAMTEQSFKIAITRGKHIARGLIDVKKWNKLNQAFETEAQEQLTQIFGKDVVADLMESLKNAPKAEQQSRILAFVRENLGAEQAAQLINKLDNEMLAKPAKSVLEKETSNRALAALKKPASKDFNDLWVQKIQAIFDANDFGRMPIEMAYQRLKNTLRKKLGTSAKALQKFESAREAFLKTGGTAVNSNRILGYKVIQTLGTRSLIMIAFNPAISAMGGTGAKHRFYNGRLTKNYGGKPPAFVEATDKDLLDLQADGMAFYLKRWAFSKGGAPVGSKFFGLGSLLGEASIVLPFINTSLMRNLLSITSNIVENVDDMAKGKWTMEWAEKWKRSFKRSLTSRSGRLLAQGVIRPFAGPLVARELQRAFGAFTTAVNNAGERKRGSFGYRFKRSFIAEFQPRLSMGAQSYANKYSRKRGGYGSSVLGAKRKLGFMRRPISALTPNSMLNPRSIGRFKV